MGDVGSPLPHIAPSDTVIEDEHEFVPLPQAKAYGRSVALRQMIFGLLLGATVFGHLIYDNLASGRGILGNIIGIGVWLAISPSIYRSSCAYHGEQKVGLDGDKLTIEYKGWMANKRRIRLDRIHRIRLDQTKHMRHHNVHRLKITAKRPYLRVHVVALKDLPALHDRLLHRMHGTTPIVLQQEEEEGPTTSPWG